MPGGREQRTDAEPGPPQPWRRPTTNAALWRIAIVRLKHDQATRDYMAKRQAESKTKSEATRCLKRDIAREIYNSLATTALT